MNIRIPVASYHPRIGGQSSHITWLSKGLKALGHNVEILSLSHYPGFIAKPVTGVLGKIFPRYFCCGKILSTKILENLLCGSLEKKKGGIVNAQDVVATMAAKRANYKVILTVHGDITREFHALGMLNAGAYQWFLNYEMAAYQNADWIVCVDTRLKNHVIQLHQESYKKITVIHNFIDVMEFRKNVEKERERKKLLKEKLGFPDDAFVVLLTRRFVPKNGVIYALKALDELINKRRHTKYFLILAGKGEEGGLLKHFVKSNHLENYVYFCGPIPNQEIPIYYAIADVNVVPSVNIGGYIEATSISAIEGLSSGIPTVASGIGGLKEMIIDNWNGLLFEEKNHFQLADILEGLRKNYSTLQEKLSTNAYTHAIKNHHYMNASKQFEYIYENFMP